ncbi:MarR family winged helix-turn-helix transcriptional regulator [Microbacter margulisiae]|uniref:DNA-binding MarR family transcriptional regulator n=1 Tax=Microbacter margulisiae TaxID=1350067 RepID=A0A7W5DPV0_9PORP|nr:MarR family transcriptional regulator [Microbacter margulisiae]MBB3186821.1 DNA-binding MarR family transcriptional regulator [Microbacter margulisiae]
MTELNQTIDKVVDNLMYLHPLISKSFSKQMRSKTNLNPGALFIMGILSVHQTLSMSEIGRKLSMPKPHVTVLIDKLIEEKMVERISDANDRRIVNIRITKQGYTQFQIIKKEIGEDMRLQLHQLTEEQIISLADATQKVRELLILSFGKSTCCSDHDGEKEAS